MLRATIDGASVSDRRALHAALAGQLAFPEWYGGNLDALYDCLTEPGEAIELTVRSFDALEEHLGGYARAFLRVLEEVSEGRGRLRYRLEPSLIEQEEDCNEP